MPGGFYAALTEYLSGFLKASITQRPIVPIQVLANMHP